MATKYQRALKQLKQGRTWQQVADEMSDALGETVYRSDPWNVANNKSSSRKVEAALEQMGLIPGPKPRYRLACEFETEEERESFRRFFGLYGDYTFTNLIYEIWDEEKGKEFREYA
jgi:hypothetical protein